MQAADAIDSVIDENEDSHRVYLAVVFSVETDGSHYDGFAKTEDPTWISLALLNEGYESIEAEAARKADE